MCSATPPVSIARAWSSSPAPRAPARLDGRGKVPRLLLKQPNAAISRPIAKVALAPLHDAPEPPKFGRVRGGARQVRQVLLDDGQVVIVAQPICEFVEFGDRP